MSRVSALCRDGYQLIENFFTAQDVARLKAQTDRIVASFDPEKEASSIFNPTQDRKSDSYFLESSSKTRFLYEKDAFDANGKLQVDISQAFNKIGHGIHFDDPVFREFTLDKRFACLAREMGLIDPVVVQSMIIFKNPKIGGEVPSHQDASYLHAVPSCEGAVFGFWIPLEDATTENGCLEFIPGSHKTTPLPTRYHRVVDEHGNIRLEHSNPDYSYEGEFVPCPAPAGSLLVIDGLVVHRSNPNRSSKPRPIYTFHIFDQGRGSTWDERNWLQLPEGYTFPSLYKP